MLFDLAILTFCITALFALSTEINRTDAMKDNFSRKIDVALLFCMICLALEKLSIIIDVQSEIIFLLTQFSQVASIFVAAIRVFYLQQKYKV